MINKVFSVCVFVSAVVLSSAVGAATCSDVQLKKKFDTLKGFCTDVVSKKGAEWAHFKVKVVQSSSKKLKVKFKQADGSYSNTFHSKDLPDNFRTYINGKETKLKDLRSGEKLDFFVKAESM